MYQIILLWLCRECDSRVTGGEILEETKHCPLCRQEGNTPKLCDEEIYRTLPENNVGLLYTHISLLLYWFACRHVHTCRHKSEHAHVDIHTLQAHSHSFLFCIVAAIGTHVHAGIRKDK